MKPRFSRPTRLVKWLKRSHRGQALVEVALIAPVLLLLLGGIGDLGRAFYFKIAVENVAREAAHWATLSIGTNKGANTPPIDDEIFHKVASPSQESFGVSLHEAPDCVRNSAPPLDPTTAANPGFCGASLPKGQSWLFIYPPPGPSPCLPASTCRSIAVLPPGAHWSVVASNSQIVNAPPPGQGGVAEVLKKVAGSLLPMDVYASSCYTWTGVSATPSSVTMPSGTPPYTQTGLTVDLIGVSGNGNADNTASVTVTAQAGVQQSWQTPSKASTGLINPQGGNTNDRVDLSVTQNLAPGPYTFTVTATSTGGGCGQADKTTTFTWTIPTAPSPSPSPSASPSPAPTPTASPPPSPPPIVLNNPNGAQITCTVIYYFTPVTPLLFSAAQAIYIVGTATLQATY